MEYVLEKLTTTCTRIIPINPINKIATTNVWLS
jgi:hypothetical protein